MTDRAAFSRASAAAYLDMSLSTFDDTVRPFVPYVEIAGEKRPLLRWLKADLDTFLAARQKGKVAA